MTKGNKVRIICGALAIFVAGFYLGHKVESNKSETTRNHLNSVSISAEIIPLKKEIDLYNFYNSENKLEADLRHKLILIRMQSSIDTIESKIKFIEKNYDLLPEPLKQLALETIEQGSMLIEAHNKNGHNRPQAGWTAAAQPPMP